MFVVGAPRDLSKCAYVTFLTSEDYVDAAVVLARSIKATETRVKHFVLLSTSERLVNEPRLRDYYNDIRLIKAIPFDNPSWKLKDGQKRFELVLSKLRIFELTDFERVVYLDADCLVLENIDDLFQRDEPLAALHPGKRRPFVINAGVMTLRPDQHLFEELIKFYNDKPHELHIYDKSASAKGQLKNPDQAVLNGYFRYKNIPVGYLSDEDNMSAHRSVSDHPRVVHFTTKAKPWLPNAHLVGNSPRRRKWVREWHKFVD